MVPGDSLSSNGTVSRGDRTCDRLQFRIERVGEYRRRSRDQKEAGRKRGANQIAAHDSPVETIDRARASARLARDAIMAGDRSSAMRGGEREITN
jgi:hypothetical protein